jgi:hypothetical protein
MTPVLLYFGFVLLLSLRQDCFGYLSSFVATMNFRIFLCVRNVIGIL